TISRPLGEPDATKSSATFLLLSGTVPGPERRLQFQLYRPGRRLDPVHVRAEQHRDTRDQCRGPAKELGAQVHGTLRNLGKPSARLRHTPRPAGRPNAA